MDKLIFIGLVLLVVFVPFVRFLLSNLPNILHYGPLDLFNYFYFKHYNDCPNFGYIKIFTGYFGSGKSLSCVNEVIAAYKHYNGLIVWNEDMQCFLQQKVTIISNLELFGVPYVRFESEQQFIDYEVAPSEVVIFLIDEIGTVWNNRNFKNFNPDVFNNIVQSRKRRMSIYGTLPVFDGTDINVRRYTNTVVACKKTWRFIKNVVYDAKDVENCNNLSLVQPLSYSYLFVKDYMYHQYDTRQLVDKLLLAQSSGDLMTFNELNVDDGKADIKKARLKKKYKKRQK